MNEPNTAAAGVFKLPKGAYLEIEKDAAAPSIKHWASWDDYNETYRSHDEVIEAVRERVRVSVRQMCRTDVPFAVALSAGVDSSAIAALAAQESDSSNLLAVSVGFTGRPKHDERREASMLAAELKLPYEEVEIDLADYSAEFPQFVSAVDDLLAELAIFGHYSVAKAAKDHGRKVLLSGLGGDELFWGYTRLAAAVRRQLEAENGQTSLKKLRANLGRTFTNVIGDYVPSTKWRKGDWTPPPGYSSYMEDHGAVFTVSQSLPKLIRKDIDLRDMSGAYAGHLEWSGGYANPHVSVIRNFIDTWFAGNSLSLSDRVGMASGVETRLPLLDIQLAKIAFSARETLADYEHGPKYWLRQACKGLLPERVITRKKSGFSVSYHELVDTVVRRWGDAVLDGPLTTVFDRNKLARLLKHRDSLAFNRKFMLYKLVTAHYWAETMQAHSDARPSTNVDSIALHSPVTAAE